MSAAERPRRPGLASSNVLVARHAATAYPQVAASLRTTNLAEAASLRARGKPPGGGKPAGYKPGKTGKPGGGKPGGKPWGGKPWGGNHPAAANRGGGNRGAANPVANRGEVNRWAAASPGRQTEVVANRGAANRAAVTRIPITGSEEVVAFVLKKYCAVELLNALIIALGIVPPAGKGKRERRGARGRRILRQEGRRLSLRRWAILIAGSSECRLTGAGDGGS